MLVKVLEFLNTEGNFSTTVIANKLNISTAMVDDIKDRLVNMGYLRQVNCDMEMCKSCSCGCSEKKLNDKTDWEITEKGKNLLNKSGR